MQYDVLYMPVVGSRIRYNNRVNTAATPVLQQEQDEDGEIIYRQVTPPIYPQPDSHYVIRRNGEEEVAWQVYAGPFNVTVATEIAAAMQNDFDRLGTKNESLAFLPKIREDQAEGLLTNKEIAEKYGIAESVVRELSSEE